MFREYFAKYGRRLVVVSEDSSYGKPEIVRVVYPTNHDSRDAPDWVLGESVAIDSCGGVHACDRRGFRFHARLSNGGQTKPIASDWYPAKRPRGKNVKWEMGRWVRLTKRRRETLTAEFAPRKTEWTA